MTRRGARRNPELVCDHLDRRSSRDVVVSTVDGDVERLALFRRQRPDEPPVSTVVLAYLLYVDADSVRNRIERLPQVSGVTDDGECRLPVARIDDWRDEYQMALGERGSEVEVLLTGPLVDVRVERLVVDGCEVVVGDALDTGERSLVGDDVADNVEQQALQVRVGAEVPTQQVHAVYSLVVGDDVLHRMARGPWLLQGEVEILHGTTLRARIDKWTDRAVPTPIGQARQRRTMSNQETVDGRPLPPGPDGAPLVGNTFEFVRDVFGFYDTLAEYGDVVGYHIAGYDFVTLLHPDQVERVLVDDAEHYEKGDILRQSGVEFLEHGLLLTEGDEWRRQRTAMQPMFYRERVETYGETMADYAAELAGSWETATSSG